MGHDSITTGYYARMKYTVGPEDHVFAVEVMLCLLTLQSEVEREVGSDDTSKYHKQARVCYHHHKERCSLEMRKKHLIDWCIFDVEDGGRQGETPV